MQGGLGKNLSKYFFQRRFKPFDNHKFGVQLLYSNSLLTFSVEIKRKSLRL